LSAQIPPEAKADYLRRLIAAGFTHIDAVSFVSPAAVPQMADSERVLELLTPSPQVEIIGIVLNEKGAERAIKTEAVQTLGFPYSISPEFLRRNQNQTPEQALNGLRAVAALAGHAGLNVVAYLSMAFGNPYGDAWSINKAADACGLLIDCGVGQISLADTVGLAAPDRIAETVSAVFAAHRNIEIGVHLHARRGHAAHPIRAALMPVAGASIRRWAALAAARLRRTHWWETSRRRHCWQSWRNRAQLCRLWGIWKN
jgi:hydroxymethylglutaryl-CoA lyase